MSSTGVATAALVAVLIGTANNNFGSVHAAALASEGAELLLLHDFCGWNLTSWSAADVANVCVWEYVECNSGDNHVQELRVTPPLGQPNALACNLTGFDNATAFAPANMAYVERWELLSLIHI